MKIVTGIAFLPLAMLVSLGAAFQQKAKMNCARSSFGFVSSLRLRNSPSFAPERCVKGTKLLLSSMVVPNPSTADLSPAIAAIDQYNPLLEPLLTDLREEKFFRYYSVDMLGSCEYIPQELFECYSESCEIYPVDEEEVPASILNTDANEHDFALDGWARWDMPTEDYYDIKQFPEEYTAYDGSDVWKFIHGRICFNGDKMQDTDSWQEDFNKAISGVHSMISAQIIKGIEELRANGEEPSEPWTDPEVEFRRRLSPSGETPAALENLYFTYMLLLSAVSVARERLLEDCQARKFDAVAEEKLKRVLSSSIFDDPNIGIASQKLHDHAVKDQDSRTALWEARMRMREMFRIMNCVQCNKCRLHGKISSMGISTAFQILLGSTGDGGDTKRIHRVELAALMTTLAKFSTAIKESTKMMKSST
jgi:ERO1-like protein alpha